MTHRSLWTFPVRVDARCIMELRSAADAAHRRAVAAQRCRGLQCCAERLRVRAWVLPDPRSLMPHLDIQWFRLCLHINYYKLGFIIQKKLEVNDSKCIHTYSTCIMHPIHYDIMHTSSTMKYRHKYKMIQIPMQIPIHLYTSTDCISKQSQPPHPARREG